MRIEIFRDDYKLVKKTSRSVGYDCISGEDQVVKPGETKLLRTGVKIVGTLHPDLHLELHLRSSSYKLPIQLGNGVGIIESDYRDEIMIPLENYGDDDYVLRKGEAIAQIICKTHEPIFGDTIVLDNLRNGGFGSTGGGL